MYFRKPLLRWYYRLVKNKLKEWFFLSDEDIPSFGLTSLFDDENPEGAGDMEGFLETENLEEYETLEFGAHEPEMEILPSIQRNAAQVKDPSRIVPAPIVVVVNIAGKPARALIDTGSLCDFMSNSFANQLELEKQKLQEPITVQLAVLGSKSEVKFRTEAPISYQEVRETREFDIINLTSYDIILGTPFLFQHKCIVGFNPARVIIRSKESLPTRGASIKPAGSRKSVRTVPNAIVATVKIAGKPARALIDTGSLCDFMSTTLADQLKVKKEELATSLMVNLAVQGPRTKVNYKTNVEFEYEDINGRRDFDLINLSNYDLILGTLFLYQHKVMLSFNETQIAIESAKALPIKGVAVKTLES